MECPNCKALIVDDAHFCPKCNYRFEKQNTHKKTILITLAIVLFGSYSVFYVFDSKNEKQISTSTSKVVDNNVFRDSIRTLSNTDLSELCNNLALNNWESAGLLENLVIKGTIQGRAVSDHEIEQFKMLIQLFIEKLKAESILRKSKDNLIIIEDLGYDPDYIIDLLNYFNFGEKYKLLVKYTNDYGAAMLSNDLERAKNAKLLVDNTTNEFNDRWMKYKTNAYNKITIYRTIAYELTKTPEKATAVFKVIPDSAIMPIDGFICFSAKFPKNVERKLHWSADQGNINDEGKYTPPINPGNYVVTAMLTDDPTKKIIVPVTVEQTNVEIKFAYPDMDYSSTWPSLRPGEQMKLGVEVFGALDHEVDWSTTFGSIEPITTESISPAPSLKEPFGKNPKFANYTAPENDGHAMIFARSRADPTKKTAFQIAVQGGRR